MEVGWGSSHRRALIEMVILVPRGGVEHSLGAMSRAVEFFLQLVMKKGGGKEKGKDVARLGVNECNESLANGGCEYLMHRRCKW